MLRSIRDAFLICLITIAAVEVALRVAPAVIPLRLLTRFAPEVRAEIAERRNLPTVRRTITVRRDDGGPPLRIFQPREPVSRLIADRDAVDSVTTDENGFCNVPLESEVQRQVGFVAVGDSFTWCTGVRPEDAWVSRLSQLTGVGGYNLGLGGVGVYEYLQLLAHYGLPLRPRVVLLNYYEGNDLRGALGYERYLAGGDDPLEHEMNSAGTVHRIGKAIQRAFDTPIVGDSYALNLALASSIEIYLGIERARHPRPPINFRYHFESPEGRVDFNLENTDTDEVAHARALREGKISLAVLEQALARFAELADQHGFTPVVLYTPSAYTAYADTVEFEDPELRELMPWFSRTQREFLRAKCRELGCRFIDLTTALREAAGKFGPGTPLYFPTNLHLSKLGNEVVARELAHVLALDGPSGTGG